MRASLQSRAQKPGPREYLIGAGLTGAAVAGNRRCPPRRTGALAGAAAAAGSRGRHALRRALACVHLRAISASPAATSAMPTSSSALMRSSSNQTESSTPATGETKLKLIITLGV